MAGSDEARGQAVGAVYFGYFAALGIAGPFLALYLERHGFSAPDAAYLLALLPITRVIATPAWTLLADALRSARTVLQIVGVGAMIAFAGLEWPLAHPWIVLVLVLFTIFRSPATALIDVLALQWIRDHGGQFGHLRAWGTVGFTVVTFAVGFVIRRGGIEWIVHGTVLMLALTTLASYGLPSASPPHDAPVFGAIRALSRRPRFLLFLAGAGLHEIGLGAYDGLFAAHLTQLANATYAGIAVAFGATAEVVFMASARPVLARLGLERTLAVAYVASALRWALCAFVRDPVLLVLVQGLHAFTFGAFYTAGVALVDRESPPEVRTSAQGVFGAFTWGLANSLALLVAGGLFTLGGMRLVFQAGALAAVLAAAIMAYASRQPAA